MLIVSSSLTERAVQRFSQWGVSAACDAVVLGGLGAGEAGGHAVWIDRGLVLELSGLELALGDLRELGHQLQPIARETKPCVSSL
jgi:hypothetical protein